MKGNEQAALNWLQQNTVMIECAFRADGGLQRCDAAIRHGKNVVNVRAYGHDKAQAANRLGGAR